MSLYINMYPINVHCVCACRVCIHTDNIMNPLEVNTNIRPSRLVVMAHKFYCLYQFQLVARGYLETCVGKDSEAKSHLGRRGY